uniref:GNAT family N-acetyltransferase n=1 Tax=Flavobacterium sp. TaxID=239 RepID=UPI0040492467
MEIKDNELLRQFETLFLEELVTIEYARQERKIFLTKINSSENIPVSFVNEFIEATLKIAEEQRLKVVPSNPAIANFFRKNPSYKELLPPGIKI